jgi:hypothetical protein
MLKSLLDDRYSQGMLTVCGRRTFWGRGRNIVRDRSTVCGRIIVWGRRTI